MTPEVRRIHNARDKGFSAAVTVPVGTGTLVFISGEIGRDSEGKLVAGGMEAEARQCFANIRHALERAGAGFGHVVRITAYVKDLADYPAYSKVRSETFGADWPASASVGVSDLLLDAKVEVDAVAFIPAG
jgi:2-iminobutanoate/2-iminopropanoate deaminase